jgi:hypothetical protein
VAFVWVRSYIAPDAICFGSTDASQPPMQYRWTTIESRRGLLALTRGRVSYPTLSRSDMARWRSYNAKNPLPIALEWRHPRWAVQMQTTLGFGCSGETFSASTTWSQSTLPITDRWVVVPDWAVATALAIPLVLWLARRRLSQRLTASGFEVQENATKGRRQGEGA